MIVLVGMMVLAVWLNAIKTTVIGYLALRGGVKGHDEYGSEVAEGVMDNVRNYRLRRLWWLLSICTTLRSISCHAMLPRDFRGYEKNWTQTRVLSKHSTYFVLYTLLTSLIYFLLNVGNCEKYMS